MKNNSIPSILTNKNFVALAENHQAGSNRKAVVVHSGGARSGKTWSILEYLIQCSINMPGIVISVYRRFSRTLVTTAIRDFLDIMQTYHAPVYSANAYNKTDKRYMFGNGSIIEFAGADDAERLRGGARDILFINEATELAEESYRQLKMRTRLLTIIDFNPSMGFWGTELASRDDTLSVHSTYKDNQHLTDAIIAEIEGYEPTRDNRINGTADEYLWQVFGLGLIARPDGAIFKFVQDCNKLPSADIAMFEGVGLDFGYGEGHPTGVVRWRLAHNKLYLHECICETGLILRPDPNKPSRPSVVSRLEEAGITRSDLIIADSARPDLIAELASDGWNVSPAKKGQGSVMLGISIMQRFEMYVTRPSINLKRQLVNYHWKKRADGTTLMEPEKRDDDTCDAARYSIAYELEGMQSQATRTRIKSRMGRTKRRIGR